MGILGFFRGHRDQPESTNADSAQTESSASSSAQLASELEDMLSKRNEAEPHNLLEDMQHGDFSELAELPPEFETHLSPTEQELTELPIGHVEALGGGVNTTQIMQLIGDGAAVFKPVSGEYDHYRVGSAEIGGQCHRERAGYLVSKMLDFDLAPPTVIRTINGETGSLQDFAEKGRAVLRAQVSELEYQKLWLFDCLIFNTDRHTQNILQEDGRLIAIDNGMAFRERFGSEQRTFNPLHYPESEIDPQFRQEFLKTIGDGKKMQSLLRELTLLLPEDEIADFQSRTDWLRDCLSDPNGSARPWEEFRGSPYARKYQPY